jgi:uncharacterized protein (TIGR03435 family)
MLVRRLIAFAIFPLISLFAQDLTGTWQGVVTNPDTRQELRTVLRIASSEGSPIKGNFYSIDQTYLVFPFTLTLQGSNVKVNIPGIGAVYDAKLSADGNTMTGTVRGFSVPAPWNLKRVSNPAEEWALLKPPAPAKLNTNDPSFEVATIKPSVPNSQGRGMGFQNGTFSTLNLTLTNLVTFAYDLHPNQIVGAPAWSTVDKYDITAKIDAEGQPSPEQLKSMLRKLIANRFQLAFHKEQRELPVYTLSVARSGLKISKNEEKNETGGVINRGIGSVLLNNLSMDEFTRMLQTGPVDRPVVNQTSLDGKYTFSLVWTPAQILNAPPNTNTPALGTNAETPPDIYTAVQQQLGLKLDAVKLRIEVLAVDKAEKPSEN